MIDDPIVMEVRAARRRYAKQFDYDIDRIFADLKRSERGRDAAASPVVGPKPAHEAPDGSLQKVRFGGGLTLLEDIEDDRQGLGLRAAGGVSSATGKAALRIARVAGPAAIVDFSRRASPPPST